MKFFMKISRKICLLALIGSLFAASRAHAVNWEQQSERLLQISGALLEGVPIGDPPTAKWRLGIFADLSLLPKVNPTIGAKKEKVPSSPVHAVPSLFGSAAYEMSEKWKLTSNLQAGYLMPGLESLLGVKAKLSQWTAGGTIGVLGLVSKAFALQFDMGAHLSNSHLVGAITAPDAKDEFRSQATVLFVRPGLFLPESGIWTNLTLGTRSTESKLVIPSDQTTLNTKDNMKDAGLPFFFQPAIGYTHQDSGVVAGLGLMFIPARAYFPRIHLGWNYLIDADNSVKKEIKETQSKADPTKKKKKKKRKKRAP